MGLRARYMVIYGTCPDEVPARMVAHWNSVRMSLERNKALQGAFAAHVKAWHALVHAGSIVGIVLEDDCIFYRPHPHRPEQYPTNAITLLGGCFRGFGAWGMCETSYISGGKFVDTIAHLTKGVHELPVQTFKTRKSSQMRRAMCVAYYVPPGMAAQLIGVVSKPERRNVFKSLDTFLEPFTKYFLWPPAFGDQGKQSLCFTHQKDLATDLCCSDGMRKVAATLGYPLPPPGCSTIALLDCQVRQSKRLSERAQSCRAHKRKTSR